ncbi:MAG: hypothetical protein SNJ84_07950, partial [Verrucomicrobiia bacterium]
SRPAFALVGDADALALGSGSYFEQSESNPARQARQQMEALLAGSPGHRADGSPGFPVPSVVGAHLRALWLDWLNGQPPLAGDVSTIDWDYFQATKPPAPFPQEGLDFADLATTRAAASSLQRAPALEQAEELFAMLDPALVERGEAFLRQTEAALRRTILPHATVFGYEDERDPLGRPKIDLVRFLHQFRQAAGANGNPNLLRTSELWARLRDPGYHRVYDPGLKANDGRPRSFLQSLNRFAGDGVPTNNANGEAAALQMLVNLIEYTLPPEIPPLIQESSGLVGMRSVPYVVQVTTRARSALWLLPEADRNDLERLLARNPSGQFTYTYNGKPLSYYLTHVLLEVALACLNPDPFASRPFHGTLTLNYSWSRSVPGATQIKGPQTQPLVGLFAPVPEPGDEPKRLGILGNAIVFELGVLPASVLDDPSSATLLRIDGWEIRDAAGLWHKVPVRHPGQTAGPRPWWRMSQAALKVNAIGAFDPHLRNDPHIPAVGWFVRTSPGEEEAEGGERVDPPSRPLKNRFQMMAWDEPLPPPHDEAGVQRMRNFIGSLRWRMVTESVMCLDPPLGHRTGNPNITATVAPGLQGHVFGTTGHPWRHVGSTGVSESEAHPDFSNLPIDPQPSLLTPVPTPTISSRNIASTALLPHGIGLQRGTLSLAIPNVVWSPAVPVSTIEGRGGPGGFLTNLKHLNTDRVPLASAELRIRDDGKWLEKLAETRPDALPKAAKPGRDSDIETLEVAKIPEIKALKTEAVRGKHVKALFCGAPRGRLMTSIGEIGLVHSGLPNFPILTAEAHGWNEFQLNCPKNGPPMRMLLDLFTPGAFSDPESGQPVSETAWAQANAPSVSPDRPRRGTWNVNAFPAHEGYLTLREGSTQRDEEMKKEFDPSALRARVIWHPAAGGWRRNSFGNEHASSKKLSETDRKIPGEPLDRLASPFAHLPRGWLAWIGLVGGDFSPSRAIGSGAWSFFAPGYNTFAPGQFTWAAGRGLASGPAFYQTAFAQVGPDESLHSRLLTFGSDGRKELELEEDGTLKKLNENDGFLRGRFTADEWLDFQKVAFAPVFAPRSWAPRFAVFPLRHRISDLALDFNYASELERFKTALNPRTTAYPPVVNDDGKIQDQLSDHNHFPGGHHTAGLFRQLPLALLANQASTSANAFTVHIVAQTIRDTGQRRSGIPLSGPGYSDPDDIVLAEQWARAVILRAPPVHPHDTALRLQLARLDLR